DRRPGVRLLPDDLELELVRSPRRVDETDGDAVLLHAATLLDMYLRVGRHIEPGELSALTEQVERFADRRPGGVRGCQRILGRELAREHRTAHHRRLEP